MRQTLKLLLQNKSGATAIEYGLIAAVLSLAIIAGVGTTANSISDMFSNQGRALQEAFSYH